MVSVWSGIGLAGIFCLTIALSKLFGMDLSARSHTKENVSGGIPRLSNALVHVSNTNERMIWLNNLGHHMVFVGSLNQEHVALGEKVLCDQSVEFSKGSHGFPKTQAFAFKGMQTFPGASAILKYLNPSNHPASKGPAYLPGASQGPPKGVPGPNTKSQTLNKQKKECP